ncbi:hypothetical protein BHE74_00013808, partial [Ensete ventricosum]
ARARQGEARAPRSISRWRASKRRRLGARPSPGAGLFGRAPGLNQAIPTHATAAALLLPHIVAHLLMLLQQLSYSRCCSTAVESSSSCTPTLLLQHTTALLLQQL